MINNFLYLVTFGLGVLFCEYAVPKIKKINLKSGSLNLPECDIPKANIIPKSSTVIIGHAYGSATASTVDDYLASSVLTFLRENILNIDNIIFSGDIFLAPSSKKFQNLYSEFNNINIEISPGNHEIGRPDSREVFYSNDFIKKDYPFYSVSNAAKILVSDSVSSDWKVDMQVDNLIKQASGELIIVRHNIVISELLPFANSLSGFVELPSVTQFVENYPKSNKYTWVMGDGGAFESLPRMTCHEFENHRFVVNGLGEVDGDTLLLVFGGELYAVEI